MTGQVQDPTTSFPEKEAQLTRIVLLRHGAAGGSREALFISRTNVELLPEGEEQVKDAARRAAHWLESTGEVLVFSSPLLRAKTSAEIFCAALPSEVSTNEPSVVDDLIELDLGDWEGESYESLMKKDPERMKRHYENFVTSKAPGGEALADLAARVRPAMEAVRRKAAGRVAVVAAHAAVNRVIVCDALGAPLESFFRIELGLGSFCVIDYHAEAPLVRLLNG
ncbi:MAG: histidine phosphatase family protein [Nitrospinaceae bacterium]|nr:histidine phosphatase family protein [Nitrospinaceae bacterium]MBT3434565.1 histidine phosphatase family protein [Nitrospinaceae bacterium]MBT3823024.1 histidine phosphatase family protein [Nitrospinaceae bacterium]MBT4095622.1 histidine phosphatase family protein [Nitrospinaceae bacterium]MBT4431075.1 histidine phosphatase family protein [Nitrospinaceae bacterium]